MKQPPALCIMGPTATGKTDFAAYVFERLPCRIISVDSSLVYKGMDVGTAKPDEAFLQRYPHDLVDIRHPQDTFSAADFLAAIKPLMQSCEEQRQIPVFVGGTMFYYHVLERGLPQLPAASTKIRQAISRRAENEGWPALHAELAKLDAARAEKIAPMDQQRIQRALEIVLGSGEKVPPVSPGVSPVNRGLLKLALVDSDRSHLHQRIEKRFATMLEAGLQQEVESLLSDPQVAESAAMKMIGYRQMRQFIDGEISHAEMILKAVAATRQLAKRQLTWLRNQANVTWWSYADARLQNFDNLFDYLRQFYTDVV